MKNVVSRKYRTFFFSRARLSNAALTRAVVRELMLAHGVGTTQVEAIVDAQRNYEANRARVAQMIS